MLPFLMLGNDGSKCKDLDSSLESIMDLLDLSCSVFILSRC
jgi:hypothetical protein